MRDYELTLNLVTNDKPEEKIFKQFDCGNEIKLEVLENENLREDKKLVLSNQTVLAFFKRADGQVLQKNCTIKDGNIIVKTSKDVLGVPGTLELECLIKDGSVETTTTRMSFDVKESIARDKSITEDERYKSDLVTELLDVRDNVKKDTIDKITAVDEKVDANANKLNSLESNSATKQEVKALEDKSATKSEMEESLKGKASNADVYTKSSLDSLLNNKRSKTDLITLNDLATDVKEKMTGGAVAVVGYGAVETTNIKNDAVTALKIANGAVGRLKQVGSIAKILTKNSIEINIKEGLLKIKNAPYIFTDATSVKFGKDSTNFNIDKTAVLSKAYALYADMATLTIEFGEISKITNPYMILCYIVFSGNINNISVCYCGNNSAIKIFDNQGVEVVEREHSACEQGFIYPNVGKQLSLNLVDNSTTDITVTAAKNSYILSTNYAISFPVETTQTITLQKNTYLSKLYFNFSTNKFEAYNFTTKIHAEPNLIFICWFSLNSNEVWGQNKDCIYTQGGNTSQLGSCNCLGDSLTYGLFGSGRLQNPYPAQLKDLCGFTSVNNYGISSSTVATNSSVSDWNSVRNPMVLRYSNMSDEAKVITAMCGSNDFMANVPKGNKTDTTTETYYGALNTLFLGLKKKYPKQKILVITPTPIHPDKEALRTDGITFEEWTRINVEVARKYRIPVLDLFYECGITPELDEQSSLLPDKLHWSQELANILARKIGKFINNRL